ncbi:MAG: hypothetical protein AB7F09_17405 [Parvibaculaceae bacterium]
MKWLVFPIALGLAPLAVAAGEISSLYSDLDLKSCRQLALFEDEGEGGEWSCPGIEGYDVRIWEGDLRSFVGFGKMAPAQCASAQTFGAFNRLGPRVEWRMQDGKPFATILRWFTEQSIDGGDPVKQNWLVVTRLGEKDACHIAYIDTKYADANEVARQRADEKAAGFDCARDMPEIFSSRGGVATDYASGMPCPGGPYREE